MQNINVKYLSEADKHLLLDGVMKDFLLLKKLNKKLSPKRNYRYEDNEKFKYHTYIADRLREKRREMRKLQCGDILSNKVIYLSRELNNNKITCPMSWYETEDGADKSLYPDFLHQVLKEENVSCYPLQLLENGSYNSFFKINPKFYWDDELKEFIKSKGQSNLHSKLQYYRIDNKFYKKEEFFLFKGKLYSKQEFMVFDDELVKLSDTLFVNAENYNFNSNKAFKRQYFLKKEDGTEFKNNDEAPGQKFIRIGFWTNDLIVSVLTRNFIRTGFKTNNIRYYTNHNYGEFYFTKEEVMDLSFCPSEEHKKLYKKIKTDYVEHIKKNSNPSYTEEMFDEKVMRDLRFTVNYIDTKKKSLLGKIMNEIFVRNRGYSPTDFNKRIAILKELLLKEKEYANKSR